MKIRRESTLKEEAKKKKNEKKTKNLRKELLQQGLPPAGRDQDQSKQKVGNERCLIQHEKTRRTFLAERANLKAKARIATAGSYQAKQRIGMHHVELVETATPTPTPPLPKERQS